MLRSIALAAMAVTIATWSAAPARADVTVTRAKNCGDKIFVYDGANYAVLTAIAANLVADGDTLGGDVGKIGQTLLYDRTSGQSVSVLVEEIGLDKAHIAPRIAASCHSAASRSVSGTVERSTGCGSRIFVNTLKGYAVLERLSGGTVFDGDTVTGDFDRPGRAMIEDRQSGATVTVFVEDFQLSRSAVERKMTVACRLR